MLQAASLITIFCAFSALRSQNQGTYLTSYITFSDAYRTLINELSDDDASFDEERWWLNYWDLMVCEVIFHRNGYIDQHIFELWVTQYVNEYNNPPLNTKGMMSYREAKTRYLGNILANHHDETHQFFEDISHLYELEDMNIRALAIYQCVKNHSKHTLGFHLLGKLQKTVYECLR